MGLDMYLKASKYLSGWDHASDAEKATFARILDGAGLERADIDGGSPSGSVEFTVCYWRKANAIHA